MTAPTAAEPPAPATPTRTHRLSSVLMAHPFGVGFVVTLGVMLALVLGLAVGQLSTVLMYITFALFAALGLDPVVRWLSARGLPKGWAILTVLAAFGLVIAGVLMLVIPVVVGQITQFVSDLPRIVSDFQKSDIYAWLLGRFGDSIPDLVSDVQRFLTNPTNIAGIGGGVFQFGMSVVSGISGGVIVLVLTLYFTASIETMKHAFYRLAPAYKREALAEITDEITESVGGYLMGMVILAFCNSVVTLVLSLILQLPFPALLAVISFCITLIPLIGSVLFWVIGSSVALFAGWVPALIFAAVYLVYMQLEAYFLTPKVMNRTISIPGSLVVIGALVGGTLLGLLGALVAIPVTASLLLIVKKVWIPRQDAIVRDPDLVEA